MLCAAQNGGDGGVGKVLLADRKGHPKAILLENADGARGAEIARRLGAQDGGRAAQLLELGKPMDSMDLASGDSLKMSGFATGNNMSDHYTTVLPSRHGFDRLGPRFDQLYAQHLDMEPLFEQVRDCCKNLPGWATLFSKAGKGSRFSHLETRVQKYPAEAGDFDFQLGDISWQDGGKLHPHTDAKHTGLVMLVSIGATCDFLVDLTDKCQLQQHGRWEQRGKLKFLPPVAENALRCLGLE